MTFRTLAGGAALAGLVLTATTLGHVDDPKERSLVPAYDGPGYRSSDPESAAAGVPVEFASSGVTLLSWLPLGEFPGQSWGNDCWGYTSPSGREYALMGLSDAMAVVDLSDPGDPQVVNMISGPNSIWRDVKTYDSYAYVVSEGGSGIQVVDLTNVDSGSAPLVTTITLGGSSATHNVVINEDSGHLYRCGGDGHGLRIYSLANPAIPAYVTAWDDRYVHDCEVVTMDSGPWAGREIAFLCSGFNNGWVETGLDILDVTDKFNIIQLARYEYPLGAYSHQGSLSADRQYFYLNDEQDEDVLGFTSKTHVIDVSDLENPIEVSDFTNGLPSITHNLYVVGDRMYAANYSSGLRIFDVSNPTEGAEIAWFDTDPDNNDVNFESLWSNYPYFQSGVVIGSDRQRGLFVWWIGDPELDFSYPDGVLEDIPIGGATMRVQIDVQESATLVPGTEKLHYDFGEGQQELTLTPLGGSIYEAAFPVLPCDEEVSYYFSAQTESGIVWRDPVGSPANAFTAIVGNGVDVLFADDMESDQGWQPVNLGASSGQWQRGVPVDDPDWSYDPSGDGDGSGQAWLTQNEFGNTDVDDGSVQLLSPQFELGGGASVTYRYYLRLTVSDGVDRLLVEMSGNSGLGPWLEVARHDLDSGGWVTQRLTEDDLVAAGVTPAANMVMRFTANDGDEQSIVEAGIDGFSIERTNCEDTGPVEDIDDSGAVDVGDLLIMLAAWGGCPPDPDPCPADLDGDGTVNVVDLLQLLGAWTP